MSPPTRILAALAAALVLSSTTHFAHASGAVLTPAAPNDATSIDVDLAIAITPYGTTRWSRLTVTAASSVLWLVPARPGATVDVAPDAFLDALDNAGTPRILPPMSGSSACASSVAETVPFYGTSAPEASPTKIALETTAAEAKSDATARGFVIPDAVAQRIDAAYADGYELVAIELPSSGAAASSPTLRVSDDGAALMPLALTGGASTNVRVMASVIASGAADLETATTIDPSLLTWGPSGSNYSLLRDSVIDDELRFLRESASQPFFTSVPVPTATAIPALTTILLGDATCTANALASANTAAPRVCGAGAVLQVPGGTACVSSGASALSCGSIDDLAIALSGTTPANAVLTRFSGAIAANGLGSDIPISISSDASAVAAPIVHASSSLACAGSGSSGAKPDPTVTNASRPHHYVHESSCTGSTTSVVYDDDDETDVVDTEGCGGSSDSTASDSDSTDKSSDNSTDNSSTDDSSDKSDDSCSSSDSKTESSNTGHTHHRSSPVSRYALLFVALLLPLRRGLRVKKL